MLSVVIEPNKEKACHTLRRDGGVSSISVSLKVEDMVILLDCKWWIDLKFDS